MQLDLLSALHDIELEQEAKAALVKVLNIIAKVGVSVLLAAL